MVFVQFDVNWIEPHFGGGGGFLDDNDLETLRLLEPWNESNFTLDMLDATSKRPGNY